MNRLNNNSYLLIIFASFLSCHAMAMEVRYLVAGGITAFAFGATLYERNKEKKASEHSKQLTHEKYYKSNEPRITHRP